jgi:hypothetical protein
MTMSNRAGRPLRAGKIIARKQYMASSAAVIQPFTVLMGKAHDWLRPLPNGLRPWKQG